MSQPTAPVLSRLSITAFALHTLITLGVTPTPSAGQTPPNHTVAFIGDQGLGPNAVAVLELIHAEGADAVVHGGDFDYDDDPQAWEAQIDSVLGPTVPYFACVGNHDDRSFCGPDGYQAVLEARMRRLGLSWEGSLGALASVEYAGIRIVLTSPDIYECGDACHANYIRDVFAADDSIWRVSSWHKNMRLMQVGDKQDTTGWGVYEASRRAGAIIATAHEHSYSRTHLLSNCSTQSVADSGHTLVLRRDDPETAEDEGRSFVFVSGLGGRGIRDQELDGPWWASIYTSDQGATYGALFGVFNDDGNPCRARFYFKNIDGELIDEFVIFSTTGQCGDGAYGDPPPTISEAWPCSAIPGCEADVDDDGEIGFSDLLAIMLSLGPCNGWCPGDVNGDGYVDFSDLLNVIVNWGPCGVR